jgi:hypothetical protein
MNHETSIAPALLRQIASGHMGARAVQVAVKVGIFDVLAVPVKTSASIAAQLGLRADPVHRLLRALAAIGLAIHQPPDRFGVSELGELLNRDHPASLRHLVMLFGSERSWRSWGRLEQALHSGKSQARELYGVDGFEYFRRHPQEGRVFHAAMAEVSHRIAQDVVRCVDFSRYSSIVDVGGGNGELLETILRAAPGPNGVLFDLEQALEGAQERFKAAALQERCEIVAGDFFAEIPQGRALYVLKNILHDWPDDDCARILKQLRRAMPLTARLLVVERVLPDHVSVSSADRQATLMDLNMLVTAGGRERTSEEFHALLGAAGFVLADITPLEGAHRFSVMRATPAAS